jgi:hypothetical protein
MSPVRKASRALADVMHRSEQRGAEKERERLRRQAQARHESAGHAATVPDFVECRDPGCVALADILPPPEA